MDPSASIYTKDFNLRVYDFLVLKFCNFFVWRCPTGSVLLPFFQEHLGVPVHLDVGVGSGYYPAASARALARTKTVALLDLNPATLHFTRARMSSAGYAGAIEDIEHSVFDPLPKHMHGRFDAISLFYVIHCLPGALPQKASAVFANLAPALALGGIVYGATILGKGANVHHNWLGRFFMRLWNSKGVFSNQDDTREGLEEALRASFAEYEVRQVGVVALFKAKNVLVS